MRFVPAGHRVIDNRQLLRFHFLRLANTLPTCLRLAAMTPSPTRSFLQTFETLSLQRRFLGMADA
jgi:hypothetical protein